MKKARLAYMGALVALMPAGAFAQSAIDAQQVTQPDFKGTARFMSMGGAFTALGGDLSTMTQNPAGIGIYRSSEVGITLDIDMQSTSTPFTSNLFPNTDSQTKVNVNNFGYVGSTRLNGALKTFNWGVSFNRVASFDRVYRGYVPQTSTSLSNYIADFSYGTIADDLNFGNNYDPYLDSNNDWLSILAYNSYMINPVGNASPQGNEYAGLYKNGTVGDALFNVQEKGYVDEYDISFGGNVENTVYWGLSIGITDLNYRRWTYYSENMANAEVPADEDGSRLSNGAAAFDLDNFKFINGSGVNIKAGLIFKPINEFRIGFAVHTPTWYNLNTNYNAGVQYTYTPTDFNGNQTGNTLTNNGDWEETDNAYYEWKLNAPWKFMVGAAAVIGNRAIVSLDYQFDGYNSMSMKVPYSTTSWDYSYVNDDFTNDQIKSYFKNANTIRAGIEYRVTPQLSLRAGYNVQMTNVKEETERGELEVYTSGTDPSYSLDKTTQYITAGIGYRYKAWYIDASYIHKNRESTYHAYTDWAGGKAPTMKVTDNNNSIVLSTGFRF